MLLEIDKLSLNCKDVDIVKDVSIKIAEQQAVALVGESGSGKTITALAIADLLPEVIKIDAGKITLSTSYPQSNLERHDRSSYRQVINKLHGEQLRKLRGKDVAYIFQEPLSALNPLHKIGKQIAEVYIIHNLTYDQQRVKNLMARLGLPMTMLDAYPHQLSGGQRQRILIIMALLLKPRLIIADEPTTALDKATKQDVIRVFKQIKRETSLLFISHDLNLVADLADHIYVMQNGTVVEDNNTADLLKTPKHDYTRELIAANNLPPVAKKAVGVDEVISIEDLNVNMPRKAGILGFRQQQQPILRNVNFHLHSNEMVGIIGESGSGKTTLARAIMGLCKIQSGKIIFNGKQLHGQQRDKLFKAQCHYIFQDPLSALNPRHTVYDLWAEGLLVHDRLKISRQNFLAMSDKVGLPADCLDKYPYEFSGGQRQRITLGRALLLEPKVILFDEPTSALDVSTQKKVVELIKALGMRGIFISHDLNVVRSLCDRVYMMKQGTCVVERLS